MTIRTVCIIWCATLGLWFAESGGAAPLPEGNTGIAARYPGDVGISTDASVVFADDFESYASAAGLSARWNGGVYHYVDLVTTGTDVFAGAKSLRFRNPQQAAELSNTVDRLLSPKQDVLFLRYYAKFDPSFDVTGSSHNGSCMSASYFINGNATPGVPADGYNKFLACFECWRGDSATPSPGDLNVYIYHPEQRTDYGDHFFPTGLVMPWTYLSYDFGTDFIARPDTIPTLGQWYCYEFMIKANTPGLRDGRIACWLDGKLIADFMNLRLRDIDTLKIDRFGLSCHIGSNTVCETFKFYDNVVAATSYIGPLAGPNSVAAYATKTLRNRIAACALYSLSGQLVRSFQGPDNSGTAGLVAAERGLPPGVYIVRVTDAGQTRIIKRVVLR